MLSKEPHPITLFYYKNNKVNFHFQLCIRASGRDSSLFPTLNKQGA